MSMLSEASEIALTRGHGASNPSIIFIIDHPYGDDLNTGYALTGAAEHYIKSLLSDNGLYLNQYYRTALIKSPPAIQLSKEVTNKEYIKTNEELIKAHAPILIDEINQLEPNLLIPLGELGFHYLTGLFNIRKFRGSVLMTSPLLTELRKPVKVFPVLGAVPYLYQDYKMRMISSLDFGRVAKYASDAELPEKTINPWVCRTPGALRSFLDRNTQATLLTFDIETYLQVPICVSLCFDGKESACVPLIDNSIEPDQAAIMWMLVGKLLAGPIAKGNQNIKYDLQKLERWHFKVNNIREDCMLAASCLYPEFPKNLGFLTSIYTELPYFKDEGKDFDPSSNRREQYYLYNAKDSIAAWQIIKTQQNELLIQGVDYVYRQTMRCLPIYSRSEQRGIRIDISKQEVLLAKYYTLFEIEKQKLQQITGNSKLNPLSSLQMNTLVFDEMKYSPGRYVTGTDEDSLQWLMANARHPSYLCKDTLRIILNCRKFHKVLEILQLNLHPDGRFRHEANLAGTETGRTSGGKCTDQLIVPSGRKNQKGGINIEIKNLGHSLQTIGKHGFVVEGETYGQDIREIFIPSRGYRFVEIDLSGAEARVCRVLGSSFDMDVFENPGIHKLTGGWLYNCDPHEIKKNTLVEVAGGRDVDRYHEAKTVRHAAERNMGPDRLVSMIGRSREDCVALLNTLHGNEPAIKNVFHKSIVDALSYKSGGSPTLIMPNGRRRDFFDRLGHDVFNEAISLYPQAIVSDQTKFCGIVPTFEKLLWAEMLVEAHDGCLAEVPVGRELEFAAEYVRNIEVPINFRQGTLKHDFELTIPAEVAIGDSWGNLVETKL